MESKQNIGDQLRAFAKQRRDAAGVPFEPHPATRKLLQDEVARTFSARTIARQTSPASWLSAFWMRLAFAGGMVALFVVATIFWMPKDSDVRTNVAEKTGKTLAPQSLSTAPQTPTLGVAGSREDELPHASENLALKQKEEVPQLAKRSAAPPPTSPEASLELGKAETDVAQATRSIERQRTEAESVPKLPTQGAQIDARRPDGVPAPALAATVEAKLGTTPPTIQDQKTAADQLQPAREITLVSSRSDRVEQRSSLAADMVATNVYFFSQADARTKYRRNLNSPPLPPVLRSFQVQQSGANVQILDADGSVYEGVAEQAGTEPRVQLSESASTGQGISQKPIEQNKGNREKNVARQQRVPGGIANNVANLMFRATGTNHSMNQLVVISGELQPDTNRIGDARDGGANTANSSQAVLLRGKASIGRNVGIPIEASGTAR